MSPLPDGTLHEWRVAVNVARVGVGAGFYERLTYLALVVDRREMQQRIICLLRSRVTRRTGGGDRTNKLSAQLPQKGEKKSKKRGKCVPRGRSTQLCAGTLNSLYTPHS